MAEWELPLASLASFWQGETGSSTAIDYHPLVFLPPLSVVYGRVFVTCLQRNGCSVRTPVRFSSHARAATGHTPTALGDRRCLAARQRTRARLQVRALRALVPVSLSVSDCLHQALSGSQLADADLQYSVSTLPNATALEH